MPEEKYKVSSVSLLRFLNILMEILEEDNPYENPQGTPDQEHPWDEML